MEVLIKKQLIENIAERFNNYYVEQGNGNFQEEYKKLRELNPKTEKGIEAIIGNNSWTDIICDECGERISKGVTLGFANEDEEARLLIICPKCLRKALKLLV